MVLAKQVRVARRFLRSIRIDTDLCDYRALEGYICSQTTKEVLLAMAHHISETGQGAFTWTGPYGGGKSSLAMGLSALLSTDKKMRQEAEQVFDIQLCKSIQKALPLREKGWNVLPVVGWRGDPIDSIGDALRKFGLVSRRPRGGWTEKNLIEAIQKIALAEQDQFGGLIVFIDEMGKFLEAAALQGTDIYFFQQLAEASSRSNGRLIVIGILHQAFDEYATKLSREQRDEWAKIQGRFIDLAVSATGDEQVELISRAIDSNGTDSFMDSASHVVASLVHKDSPESTRRLSLTLSNCWPLHPVVAFLLGPISRRRFGQNQRSVFGFLNSAEPFGFQHFLEHASSRDVYRPDQLWDYLRANLEPSILASPDSHRWALAAEALERCEVIDGDALQVLALKTIAVVDLFKERSSLLPSIELLKVCFPDFDESSLRKALDKLSMRSLVLFRKFSDAYAVFAGSDFDIDRAIQEELPEVGEIDFARLNTLSGVQPLVAKRHFHETGALRWFEVNFVPLSEVSDSIQNYSPKQGACGQFVLAIASEGETDADALKVCQLASQHSNNWNTVVGYSRSGWAVTTYARELLALENISNGHPELAGDSVARREVSARLADLQSQVESELQKSLDTATWFGSDCSKQQLRYAELNGLASDLADIRYCEGPRLHNELLNRDRPSGSAVAAQNALLRQMVLASGQPRLGINGFPGEGGLFNSILHASRLYTHVNNTWKFVRPSDSDPCRLQPMWDAATRYVKSNESRTVPVSEIYEIWRDPPFGVKDGLMPVLAVAFIQSSSQHLSIYREGIFRPKFDDVDVDYLTSDASAIQLRWMDLSDTSRLLLSGTAEIVRNLDQNSTLAHLEPIDVARGLVGIYDRLPNWTKRTMRLSDNAVRIREIFKRARDPNQFLFNDLPSAVTTDDSPANTDTLDSVIASLRDGLDELVQAYSAMLHRLRDTMLAELEVPNLAPQSIEELRSRALNIQRVAGDFRVEAFVGRISEFDGTDDAFEGIASLVANKPPRDWVDPDFDKSLLNIVEMAQQFLRVETLARVKGRAEKRHAMAVFVGTNGRPTPIHKEFEVGVKDRDAIESLTLRVHNVLKESETYRENVVLAALAEVSMHYMSDTADVKGT